MEFTSGRTATRAELYEAVRQLSPGQRFEITVRDLISLWGAKGRGTTVVDSISTDLKEHRIRSLPSFEYGSLDSIVRLEQTERPLFDFAVDGSVPGREDDIYESRIDAADTTQVESASSRGEEYLSVGKIESSRVPVVSVTRATALEHAVTLMIRHDFSQIPVLNDQGGADGILSWESIAKNSVRGVTPTVDNSIARVTVLRLDDDLLQSIPVIINSGAVLVQDESGEIQGIITTADLSQKFQGMASPFLLMGECEKQLRRVIDSRFEVDELRQFVRNGRRASLEGAADMTLGDIQYFLKEEPNWTKMRWSMDHDQFIEWLDEVRIVRNEIAHFSPDPVDDERMTAVRAMLEWLTSSS